MKPDNNAWRIGYTTGFHLRRFEIFLVELTGSELGADVIEYAMLGVFMALVGAVLLHGITAMIGNSFNGFGSTLTGSV